MKKALLVLALLGLLVTLALWSAAPLAQDWLIRQLSVWSGRELTIGALAIDWGRVTTLRAEALHLANAPWGQAPALLTVERVQVAVDLAALREGQLRLPQLELVRPRLWLESAADGTDNWTLTDDQNGSDSGWQPVLGELTVVDGQVQYADPQWALTAAVTVAAAGLSVVATGRWQDLPLILRADSAGTGWRIPAAGVAVSLTEARIGDSVLHGTLRLDALTLPLSVSADLQAPLLDLRPFMTARPGAAGAAGAGANPLPALRAQLRLHAARVLTPELELTGLDLLLSLDEHGPRLESIP